jgi:hypothetical protein
VQLIHECNQLLQLLYILNIIPFAEISSVQLGPNLAQRFGRHAQRHHGQDYRNSLAACYGFLAYPASISSFALLGMSGTEIGA